MNLWHMAVCNLTRRPMRSSLTAAGVAIAVASFLAIVGMSQGVQRGWVRTLTERGTHILGVRGGTAEILTGAIDAELGERIARIEGVRSVSPELIDMVPLESGHTVLVSGWPVQSRLWTSLRLTSGRLPGARESDAALLGQALAAELDKRPGDTMTISGRRFSVLGTFRLSNVMGNNMVLLPLPTMQEMMGLPGRVTAFNIAVDRPDDPQGIESVLNRLGGAFPELRFWETKDAADNSEILRSMRATAWSVSVIAIVMGTVIVTNTLLMSVNERTREIGVLSAVGWSAGRIQGMIVLEGMLLTLAGSLAGAALGLAGVGVLTSHPRVRGFVDTDMSGALIAEVAGAAILLGLLASAYPAWRAVRINVMDAIHHE